MFKLFLDDLREPFDNEYIVVRTAQEAVDLVLEKGCPSFISFDHDLGEKDGNLLPTGYDFAKWLVNADMEKNIIMEDFAFQVHSANPVGKKNIESYLNNYLNFKFNLAN